MKTKDGIKRGKKREIKEMSRKNRKKNVEESKGLKKQIMKEKKFKFLYERENH